MNRNLEYKQPRALRKRFNICASVIPELSVLTRACSIQESTRRRVKEKHERMMAKWRQTPRRFGRWLTPRKRALPAIRFFEARLLRAVSVIDRFGKRLSTCREAARTRYPLSAAATARIYEMIECRMIYYPITSRRYSRARIGKRAPKYLSTRVYAICLSRLFSVSAMPKVFRSLRGGIKNSVDSAVALGNDFALFLMPSVCQENSRRITTFLLSPSCFIFFLPRMTRTP